MGGVDVGRTAWRVADNLEKTLLCKFLFSWAKFLNLDTYKSFFHVKYNIDDDGHVRMDLM